MPDLPPAGSLTTPTSLPCPPWCERPAGHRFEFGAPDTGLHGRYHSWTLASLTFPHPDKPGRECEVSVDLVQMDEGRDHAGPVLRTGPLFIGISEIEGTAGMSGPMARRFAAALLDAADEWDRIEGVAATPPLDPRREVTDIAAQLDWARLEQLAEQEVASVPPEEEEQTREVVHAFALGYRAGLRNAPPVA